MRYKSYVFLKVAKYLEKELKRNRRYTGTCCCSRLVRELKLLGWDELHHTREFKLFKQYYCNKRSRDLPWFGQMSTPTPYSRPHPINQQKRIDAMRDMHKIAKALNKIGGYTNE